MSAAKCSVFETSLLGAENEDCSFSGCLQRNAQFSKYRFWRLKSKVAVFSGCLQRNAQFAKHRCLELKSKIAVFPGCLQRNTQFVNYRDLELQTKIAFVRDVCSEMLSFLIIVAWS